MRLDQAVTNELAKIKDWGFGKSKTEKTFLWMEFILPELVASDGSGEVTIRKDFYFTDAALDYTLKDLATCGWTGRDVTELDKNEVGSHSFYEAQVYITTKIEPYRNDKGETKNVVKVTFINSTSYKPSLPKEELKAASSKIRGKIAAFRQKNATSAVPAAKSAKTTAKMPDRAPDYDSDGAEGAPY